MPGDDGAPTAEPAPVGTADAVASAPSPGAKARSPGRVAALDGMRAVFVVMVMAHHLVWAAPNYAGHWALGGWTGVDGFFVLSGFLIGGLLLGELDRSGTIRYGTFVARRLLRLYPAMLVAIGAMVIVSMTVDHNVWAHLFPTVRDSVLYVMNWPFGHHEAVAIEYTHLWSLGVEFQFYLTLPLLLLALAKLRLPRWSWAASIVVIMAVVSIHRARLWTGPASFPLPYVSTDARADTLLWGVLVALAIREGWIGERHRLALRILAPVAMVWIGWVVWRLDSRDTFTYDWGLTLLGLAHAVVLSWIVVDGRTVVARVLGSRPMAWLGARSYSMYLYHYPLFFFATRHLGSWTDRERVAAVLVAVVVLSDLSYRLIERPAFALKDRIGSHQSAVAPVT